MYKLIYEVKHTLLLGCVFFIFFVSENSIAQIYIRISEKDCVSCYEKLFTEVILSNRLYKILLPEKYKGKRFENFNSIYFQDKISESNVVFSDSLYKKTGSYLDDLSGLLLIHKHHILAALSIKDLSYYKIDDLLMNFSKLNLKLNLNEEGFSERLLKEINYDDDNLFIIDQLFGKLYNSNSNKISSVNLNTEDFQPLLKKYLTKEDFNNNLKYSSKSSGLGNSIVNVLGISFDKENLYFHYTLPYTKLGEYEGQKALIKNNMLFVVIQSLEKPVNISEFISNSFMINDLDNLNYYPTMRSAVYDKKLYYINQVMASQHIKDFPLLSEFIIDKNNREIQFSEYIEELSNFGFQQDSLFNTKYLNEITFLNKDNYVLLQEYPYVININKKTKYQLDWKEVINKHSFPSEIKYEHLQFWNKGQNFIVLIKDKDNYYLKAYDKAWKFKEKIKLPLNSEVVNDVRFSKDNVYLITDDELLNVPNNFENFKEI